MPSPSIRCPNCGAITHLESGERPRYCAACGQLLSLERLRFRPLAAALVDGLLSFDSRLARTLAGLARSPGRLAARYVEGHRAPYVAPIRFYLGASAITVLAASVLGRNYFDVAQAMFELGHMKKAEMGAVGITGAAMGYTLMGAVPLLGWILQRLFRGSGRNVSECIVLALYTFGFVQLLNLALIALEPLGGVLIDRIRGTTTLIWLAWGSVVFFGAPRWSGSVRALLALLAYFGAVILSLYGALHVLVSG